MKFPIELLLALLVLNACSPEKGDPGIPGQSIVGPQGIAGANGRDGVDGSDGVNGTNGADAFVEVIDPCGKETNLDEVLFRLADGRLFAYFESGSNRYLTLVQPGTYQTADGTHCVFTVTESGDVTWDL